MRSLFFPGLVFLEADLDVLLQPLNIGLQKAKGLHGGVGIVEGGDAGGAL